MTMTKKAPLITSSTRLLGIFGDPVGQSLSPVMQNAALNALGLDMAYLAFRVRTDELAAAISAIRTFGMGGVNITIPHKEKAMGLMDRLSDSARWSGAVNTIVNKNGLLTGHNTDGEGYLRSLFEDTGFDCKGKDIVMIGAGGAARGIASAMLKEKPASITILNRTFDRAEALCGELEKMARKTRLAAMPLEKDHTRCAVPRADLLVNAASLGMKGQGVLDLRLIGLERLKPTAIVSDIVYKPADTALLMASRKIGLETHSGLGMLVHQGAIAFELWTGKEAPVKEMKKALLKAVRG